MNHIKYSSAEFISSLSLAIITLPSNQALHYISCINLNIVHDVENFTPSVQGNSVQVVLKQGDFKRSIY